MVNPDLQMFKTLDRKVQLHSTEEGMSHACGKGRGPSRTQDIEDIRQGVLTTAPLNLSRCLDKTDSIWVLGVFSPAMYFLRLL